MVEIREVTTKKEIKNFLNFPLKLYKGNKNFVPALYSDEKKMFKPDYMYFDQSEMKCWNAYKDGKMVGRIQAILQFASNKKWNQERVRFCRVDFVDDEEVSKALFSCVEEYAKNKGMKEVVGPLNFSDLEREGLLIDGFEWLNTFEEQYNYPYYQKHIEKLGYSKDVDWIEHRLFYNEEKAQKVLKLEEKVLSRGKLRVVPKARWKKYSAKYKDQFFKILDDTYDKLYGTVPFTDGMKDLLINNYTAIINMNYITIIVDENDKVVAFAIAFPSMSKIFQKSGGHLYPGCVARLLYNKNHPKSVDLGLVGVTKEGHLKGAAIPVYAQLLRQMKKDKLEYLETNLNLEDNDKIINTWSHFDSIQHKKRRSYVRRIG